MDSTMINFQNKFNDVFNKAINYKEKNDPYAS